MIKTLKTAIAAIGLTAFAATAQANDWTPPGPIKLMIAFAAGGGADTQARLIADDLESKLGWQFIPEQVTGKGGMNLAMAIKDQPNDGTVIGLLATETLGYALHAANVNVTPADYTAITTTAGFQMGIVSLSAKGWKSFHDVIEGAKGEALRFGVMSPKLADLAYLLGKANDVEFNIVSVKGGKAVLNGLNAGDIDLGFIAGLQTKGVEAGDLVNLASALSEPLKQTPDAPMLADLGVPYNADGYFLIIGPKGIPAEARDALANAIGEVITTEGTKSNGMITKGFGGPAVIAGDAAQALIEDAYSSAGELMKVASE